MIELELNQNKTGGVNIKQGIAGSSREYHGIAGNNPPEADYVGQGGKQTSTCSHYASIQLYLKSRFVKKFLFYRELLKISGQHVTYYYPKLY